MDYTTINDSVCDPCYFCASRGGSFSLAGARTGTPQVSATIIDNTRRLLKTERVSLQMAQSGRIRTHRQLWEMLTQKSFLT